MFFCNFTALVKKNHIKPYNTLTLMKHVVLFLVSLFVLGASFAQAQVKPDCLTVKKGQFFDQNGSVISSSQLQQIIGNQVYNDTYVGALKQYKTGKSLILWGAIGAGIGWLGYIGCAGAYANKYGTTFKNGQMPEDPLLAGMLGGAVIGSLGSAALAAGIPLNVIGKKRLNWIADDYNGKASNVSLKVTGSPVGYGLGLALNF